MTKSRRITWGIGEQPASCERDMDCHLMFAGPAEQPYRGDIHNRAFWLAGEPSQISVAVRSTAGTQLLCGTLIERYNGSSRSGSCNRHTSRRNGSRRNIQYYFACCMLHVIASRLILHCCHRASFWCLQPYTISLNLLLPAKVSGSGNTAGCVTSIIKNLQLQGPFLAEAAHVHRRSLFVGIVCE